MTTIQPEITATVTEIAAAALGVPGFELAPDTDLRAVEGMDSVKVLRMIAKIEQAYDIELEDEDVFGVATIAGAAELVERALREGVTGPERSGGAGHQETQPNNGHATDERSEEGA